MIVIWTPLLLGENQTFLLQILIHPIQVSFKGVYERLMMCWPCPAIDYTYAALTIHAMSLVSVLIWPKCKHSLVDFLWFKTWLLWMFHARIHIVLGMHSQICYSSRQCAPILIACVSWHTTSIHWLAASQAWTLHSTLFCCLYITCIAWSDLAVCVLMRNAKYWQKFNLAEVSMKMARFLTVCRERRA